MEEKVKMYIDSHRDEIIEQWKTLVNLEAESHQLEQLEVVVNHLYRIFTEAGVKCELRETHPEGPKMLIGEIGSGRLGQPIVFSGHYDTVFPKGRFGENPFHIEDGRAYGPGCLDMKGGIIMTLYIIKALEAAGYDERPLRVVFAGDEEGGPYHNTTPPVFREAAQGCKFALNMETGPIDNSLCVGRKGAIIGSFTVHGVAAHSGNNFDAGRNAVVDAAYKMLEIDKLTNMETGTNMNVAVVNGGKMWNQIPDLCEVTYSGRFSSVAEMDRVVKRIEELMSVPYVKGTTTDYKPGLSGNPFEKSPQNLALWSFCSKVSQDLGLGEMGNVVLGGGSDAVQISNVCPTLCSCGVLGQWNHTEREYAVVETMFTRLMLWCEVVRRADEFVI